MKNCLLLLISVLTLAACKPEPIETFRVPKEKQAPLAAAPGPMAMPTNGASTEPAGHAGLIWKTPRGWVEKPASDMRVGSFTVNGANGQTADVSIVPLAGDAGGDVANINRWRGQINLPPIDDSALEKESRMETFGGRRMRVVDFVSDAPLIDNKFKKRLVAATYEAGGRTWFFKMIGEDATVKAATPAFRSFLATLKFSDEK